jgi:hypothetical protein
MFDDTTNQQNFRGIVSLEGEGLIQAWLWYLLKIAKQADPGKEE